MTIHKSHQSAVSEPVSQRIIRDFCTITGRTSISDSHAWTGANDEIPYVKPWDIDVPCVLKTREAIPRSLVVSCSFRGNVSGKENPILQVEGLEAGRVAWLGTDAILSAGLCQVAPDTDLCRPRFLYHALRSRKDAFLSIDSRFNRPRILPGVLRETTIALPMLERQENIAQILDAAETICRARKDSLALLKDLLRSVFLEMFGDPDVETERWEMKPIGEIAEIEPLPRRFQTVSHDPSIPYVQRSDLGDFWLSSTGKSLPVDNPHGQQYQIVPENSVVLAGTFDRCPRASILGTEAYIGQPCIAVHPSETCIPEYLCMSLRQSGRRLETASPSTRGGDTRITHNFLRGFSVPFPPLSAQRRYAETARQIRKQNLVLTDILKESERLYESLLDELIGTLNRNTETER